MSTYPFSRNPGHDPAPAARTIVRRSLAAVSALAAVAMGLVFMANPASAHHPEISGSATCADARGMAEVSYTTTTWKTDPGPTQWAYYIGASDIPGAPVDSAGNQYKGEIVLQYQAAGSSEWVEVRRGIEFTPANNGVFSSSFELDETLFPITLRALDSGAWKNSVLAKNSSRTAPVTLNGDCSPDVSAPTGSSSWACGADSIAVTLDNSGSTVLNTYTVTSTSDTGVASLDVPVAAGAVDTSVSFPAPVEDGGPTVITIAVGDTEIDSASYSANCFLPPVECDEGETGRDTDGDQVDDTCAPVVCDEGETAADTDGNDVNDSCEPVVCDAGETGSDTGGNDVNDSCEPVVCDEGETASDTGGNDVADTCTEVECDAGETGSDTGGNDVNDSCEPVVCDEGETASDTGGNDVADTCTEVECDAGETGSDTGGNDVNDSCEPVVCDEGETASDTGGNDVDDTCTEVECDAGETGSDTGGNDVNDSCEPVVCDEGETASDTGGNDVADTCTEVECDAGETGSDTGGNDVNDSCEPVVCDEGETASDTGGNGVDDTCTEVIDDEETPPTTTPGTTPTTTPGTTPTTTPGATPTTTPGATPTTTPGATPTTTPEVLPSTVSNPSALPNTGTDTVVLAGIGALILLAGFGLTRSGTVVQARITQRR